MKSRAEFIARFEETLAGFGLFGVYIDSVPAELKTLSHAGRAMKVPERAIKLLNAMYSFLAEPEQPQAVNGQAKQPQQTKTKT